MKEAIIFGCVLCGVAGLIWLLVHVADAQRADVIKQNRQMMTEHCKPVTLINGDYNMLWLCDSGKYLVR